MIKMISFKKSTGGNKMFLYKSRSHQQRYNEENKNDDNAFYASQNNFKKFFYKNPPETFLFHEPKEIVDNNDLASTT